ncbi:GNAT family N-acetyltransferase [Microbacterium sp. A8/3-1]|uniref:GNAT family N-acetyltransferase n=1 Tax=Microbacterium sp. A8/3-1 TaxID=3160749 RepID=UPI003313EAF5
MDCLYVAESHRGRGLGKLLLNAVRAAAASRGYAELQSQTPEWNAAVIDFYERVGGSRRTKERFTLPV